MRSPAPFTSPVRQLAPGVRGAGYSPDPGVFILESVEAQQQGGGAVGRYLDDLKARHHTILVPAVISPRLAGMLERRGFAQGEGDTWGWMCPLAPPLPAHPSSPTTKEETP